ncbi:MAG: hypothetical protein MJ252_10105 [archaeon]|nr:hypothetical protein [archaeon]
MEFIYNNYDNDNENLFGLSSPDSPKDSFSFTYKDIFDTPNYLKSNGIGDDKNDENLFRNVPSSTAIDNSQNQNEVQNEIEIASEDKEIKKEKIFDIQKIKKLNRKERVAKRKEIIARKRILSQEEQMDKLTKRKMQNRLSAQVSRDKQKKLISDLKQENFELKSEIEKLLSIINSCPECKKHLTEENIIVSDESTNSAKISQSIQSEDDSHSFYRGVSTLSPFILVICLIGLIFFGGVNQKIPSIKNIRKLSPINLPLLKTENYPALINDNTPLISVNNSSCLKDNITKDTSEIDDTLKDVITITEEISNDTLTDNKIYLLEELNRILKGEIKRNNELTKNPKVLEKVREKFLIDLYNEIQKRIPHKNSLRSTNNMNYCPNIDMITYGNKIIDPQEKNIFLPFYDKSEGENYQRLGNRVETIIIQDYFNSNFKHNSLKFDEILENKNDCLYLHLIVPVEHKEEIPIISKTNNTEEENISGYIPWIKKQYYELGCKVFEIKE